jgi:acyl carrier protein
LGNEAAAPAMSDVAARVKAIIVKQLSIDEAKVSDDASFVNDLGVDSLNAVELVLAVEKEFDCKIPDHVPETLLTVEDAISFIEDHLTK